MKNIGTQLSLFGFESTLNILRQNQPDPQLGFEYLVLISPSLKIKEQVRELKDQLDRKIGISKENIHSVPHISLLMLRQAESCDTNIINCVTRALFEQSDFNIRIAGARTFDHTYTRDLVLKVESKETENVFYSLCSAFRIKRPGTFEPHITIARGITKNKFEKLGASFHDFDLYADFICSKIIVLKRTVEISGKSTKYSKYTKIHEAHLNKGLRMKSA
ncbi:MAG TPA: 2'-5' RNA ligase family protein [Bacteroidia bacterium]|jgi:2'-5' RNA ligase